MGLGDLRRFHALTSPGRRFLLFCWLFGTLAAFVVVLRWTALSSAPSARDAGVLDPVAWYRAVRTTSVELWLALALSAVLAATSRARRNLASAVLAGVASLVATFMLLVNFAAAATLPVFGVTPNVGMLIYSDLLFSRHGRTAVVSWIPQELWIGLAVGSLVSLALALLLWRVPALRRAALAATIVVGIGLTALAAQAAVEGQLAEKSPTVTFARSLQLLGEDSLLGEGIALEPELEGPPVPAVAIDRAAAAGIRNVIVVVLESVSAEYLDPYGAPYLATPSIAAVADSGLLFENAYSNAVSSVAAMRAMLASRYPRVSIYQAVPQRPMLPEVLEQAGWRTALFHSSDNRYGATEEVLAAAGFGTTRDYRGRPCPANLIEDRNEFNSIATLDACTFDELKLWMDAEPERPSFAVLWTFQTHYPYFPDGSVPPVSLDPGEPPDDPRHRAMKQQYLTALRSIDRQVGLLMEHLRRTGLDRETLVILVGDHGQAFGQHGTLGHGGDLFEENVRVPLLFAFPGLARESRARRLTSHIDLAPSIVDLLGLDAPANWHGQSVFTQGQDRPVLFSTAWIDLVVGYRTGNRKVIARLTRNEASAFELDRDPQERSDLLAGSPALEREEIARLQSWFRWTEEESTSREAGSRVRP